MTLVTSLVSGPAMKRLLYRAKEEDVVALVRSAQANEAETHT